MSTSPMMGKDPSKIGDIPMRTAGASPTRNAVFLYVGGMSALFLAGAVGVYALYENIQNDQHIRDTQPKGFVLSDIPDHTGTCRPFVVRTVDTAGVTTYTIQKPHRHSVKNILKIEQELKNGTAHILTGPEIYQECHIRPNASRKTTTTAQPSGVS